MGRSLIVLVAACSGAAPPTPTTTAEPVRPRVSPSRAPVASPFPRAPVDVLAVLSAPRVEAGAIETAPAQLVLDGPTLQPVEDDVLDVDLLEERGSDVRVGVRLPHARFAVWTARARMLSIVARDAAVSAQPSAEHAQRTAEGPIEVVIKPGARVVPLAHRGDWTKVHYADYLDVTGWMPDSALAMRGPPDMLRGGPIRRSMLAMPGTPILASTRPGARTLAVSRHTIAVDVISTVDDGWFEVRYEDTNVRVHGYIAKRPQFAGYSRRRDSDFRGVLATNATVPALTCLFAGGEPVGFVVGAQPVSLEPGTRLNTYALTLDTPWGAVTFDARGPTPADLETCGSGS